MGSDIARVSYDPTRKYRSVVLQQGRVLVDADWNEQQEIDREELRLETLDIVGPAGTPDNGYAISFLAANQANPNYDFFIGPGTMYVGGVRVDLQGAEPVQVTDRSVDEKAILTPFVVDVRYSTQPEWLNPPPPDPTPPANEYILLHLYEQEISAVEDTRIKEVALGGPDTAQRLRIMQHIERYATTGTDCASALAAMESQWGQEGLDFDPATMRLTPRQTLQVSFQQAGLNTPCEPAAQGGYLGADNQMIRVKVVSDTQFLWGFDDASFLYRVTLDPANPAVLTLASRPVDAEHTPVSGQAVEVLLSEMQLDSDQDYVASSDGLFTTLSADYDPAAQQVTLASAITDSQYLTATAPLFLRVWNDLVTITPGVAQQLGNTGVYVTLEGPFTPGWYWMFAVRPSTPQAVYPPRYAEAPQPPDGPEQWVCPLAVIGWTVIAGSPSTAALLDDCRIPFNSLVDIGRTGGSGCCTRRIGPSDVSTAGSLQTIVDQTLSNAGRVTLCLEPGIYTLNEPLLLDKSHSGITIEGCGTGAILRAAAGSEASFLFGIIVLAGAEAVTLRDLDFDMPLVPFQQAGGLLAGGLTTFSESTAAVLATLYTSIAVLAADAVNLTIRGCAFRFPSPPEAADLYAVAVSGVGDCAGLVLQDNRFLSSAGWLSSNLRPFRSLVGFQLVPITTAGSSSAPAGRITAGTIVASLLTNASFTGNSFTGLTAAVFISAEVGTIKMDGNTVALSQSGFWIFSLQSLAALEAMAETASTVASNGSAGQVVALAQHIVQHPLLQYGSVVGRAFPLPKGYESSSAVLHARGTLSAAQKAAIVQEMVTRLASFLTPAAAAPAAGSAGGEPDAGATTTAGQVQEAAAETTMKAAAPSFTSLQQDILLPARETLTVSLTLTLTGNNIGAITGTKAASISGIFLFDEARDTKSSLVMNSNRIENSDALFPAAAVILVVRCVVVGNLILNDAQRATSLILYTSGDAVAVTGNVFEGTAILPARTNPATSLSDWNTFNTTMP